jgi:hypothetical protein
MAVVQVDGQQLLVLKGAFNTVLAICTIGTEERERIAQKVNDFAAKGYRIIAVAKLCYTKYKSFCELLISSELFRAVDRPVMDHAFFDFDEPGFQISHGKRQGDIDRLIE